jgi:hypothetical protein
VGRSDRRRLLDDPAKGFFAADVLLITGGDPLAAIAAAVAFVISASPSLLSFTELRVTILLLPSADFFLLLLLLPILYRCSEMHMKQEQKKMCLFIREHVLVQHKVNTNIISRYSETEFCHNNFSYFQKATNS